VDNPPSTVLSSTFVCAYNDLWRVFGAQEGHTYIFGSFALLKYVFHDGMQVGGPEPASQPRKLAYCRIITFFHLDRFPFSRFRGHFQLTLLSGNFVAACCLSRPREKLDHNVHASGVSWTPTEPIAIFQGKVGSCHLRSTYCVPVLSCLTLLPGFGALREDSRR